MTDLTSEEQKKVCAAMAFLRARIGNWKSVAVALRLPPTYVSGMINGKISVTARTAFRVARLAGVGVDEVLSGKYPPDKTCPLCGHREGV